MSERIFMSKADISDAEEEAVRRAIRSGWVAPLGPEVDSFETEVAQRLGVKGALALSSGTAALHLALLHLGARPGTAVVVSSMTFAASANAIAYTGAEPVFIDCQDDGNIDPDLLFQAIDTLHAEDTEVVAAMTVDLLGRCCDYTEIEAGLAKRGVPLLEDAAESLGAKHAGTPAGSFGQAAALSFNGNKIMTTSGGGMLVSNDASLIDRARYLSTQARQPVPWYEHTEIGYNYRLSNILAAIGRAQLTRLDEMINRRRIIRRQYMDAFVDFDIRFLGTGSKSRETEENCWLTAIILGDSISHTPDQIISIMNDANIEARHLWKPMHMQPAFETARSFTNGNAEKLFRKGITLPSGSELTDTETNRVIEALQILSL
ncbi:MULTISPECIES: DegT/DnrJ/EryC1/StrS family aminotransferase [unclassified Dietzia]|uniref:DegT/DnrJ/EryC1/StrS family aminotransferase n=1 Tax=unclassified Dietzia TaxID=2617939 RepID=UPI0015FA2756|nr:MULTISPECIES: aminotransferase class I/II-fold pyridoxal phosphate-dependent enzyme [unclassified Dietzia]MBB1023688.1 aminotransferase class I/II-fold pyridoxal phosphate-dependent enzyme [Dietzia sp. DQ12-76]MBB1027248.1 aminotransferase class I/II-fold pyridoxal phosphate-dependent enzyme [Dietzia sp. DQ11-38-2]